MRRSLWIYPCLLLTVGCTLTTSPPDNEASTSSSTTEQSAPSPASAIEISQPKDGDKVSQKLEVSGTAGNAEQQVWLVVHPQETADYWVQPPAAASQGQWSTEVFIGREGDVDIGQSFEIRGVSNPETPLNAGDVLRDWPKAEVQTDVIQVMRQ